MCSSSSAMGLLRVTTTSLARHVMCRSLTSTTTVSPPSEPQPLPSSWMHHRQAHNRRATPTPTPQSAPRPSGRHTTRGSPRKRSTTSHRGLRNTFPVLNSDDLVQKWIDRLTDPAVTDVLDEVGDIVEKKAIDTMQRAEVYLGLLQRSEDTNPSENCLDCTFCGAWFPPYWLLDITPQGTADWRNQYYRCCFQCVSGDNDGCCWFASHTSLSPALHSRPGTAASPLLSGQLGRATPSAGSSPWMRIRRINADSTSKPSGPIVSFDGLDARSSPGPPTPTSLQRWT